jgi:hypothetical protein
MCIRTATHRDFAIIRNLPVQLTPRPVTLLKPKHFRVLFQENNVRLLVNESNYRVCGFMALRFTPAIDSDVRFLVIIHLGLHRHPLRYRIAAELEKQASIIAQEHQCEALLVNALKLPGDTLNFYRQHGYILESETLIKKLA